MSAVLKPSTIAFHVEPWASFKTEAADLFPRHWQEVALNRDAIKLNIDFGTFDRLDEAGQLHVVVARDDGIAGYWLGVIHPHLHYRDSLTAYTDVFYMRQESRRDTWAFVRMLKFVESSLKAKGVQKMFISSKCHKDLSPIFEHAGMTRSEVVYTKLLR